MAEEQPVLAAASAKVPLVRNPEGIITTDGFLDVCRLVLPVVDKLGTAFTLVRSDINGNIQRLADRAKEDPQRYSHLFTIVHDEVVKGTHGGSTSCAKGLLWLKRAMEFMVAILRGLLDHPQDTLSKVVADTYGETLMRFHGFMVSSAFTLAFKFVPTREVFVTSLAGPGSATGAGSDAQWQEVAGQLRAFVDAFSPILADVQAFMVENNLDDPSKV